MPPVETNGRKRSLPPKRNLVPRNTTTFLLIPSTTLWSARPCRPLNLCESTSHLLVASYNQWVQYFDLSIWSITSCHLKTKYSCESGNAFNIILYIDCGYYIMCVFCTSYIIARPRIWSNSRIHDLESPSNTRQKVIEWFQYLHLVWLSSTCMCRESYTYLILTSDLNTIIDRSSFYIYRDFTIWHLRVIVLFSPWFFLNNYIISLFIFCTTDYSYALYLYKLRYLPS